MFTFGEQLYRPTQRDEETLLVEPYFVSGSVVLATGQFNRQVLLPVPQDRMLYIHSFLLDGGLSGASIWTAFSVSFVDVTGSAQRIFQAGKIGFSVTSGVPHPYSAAPVASEQCQIYVPFGLVLPPQTRQLVFEGQRSGTTDSVFFGARVSGWLIPPGRFGRF